MKSFALAALWVLASVGAVTVAWAGVSVVDSEVIAPPPATVVPLFADNSPTNDPDNETAAAPADAGTPAISSTSSTSTTSTSLAPSPTEQPGSGDSAGATDTEPSTTAAPTTPSSTAPTTSTTMAPPVTPDPEPAAQSLTFKLLGGTTTINFSAESVTAVATANPGFEVTIEPNSPGLKIEFRSVDTNQRSRIDAWWDNGPRHDITERPD